MKSRRGEIATILTIATLVIVGVTALVSSLNLNKKQTTSSRASGCAANECSGGGTLCVAVGTVHSGYKCCAAGKNPAHTDWTFASNSPVSVGCVGDAGCKQLSCSGNTTKKYYQKTTSSYTNYSDAACSTTITKTLTDYCKETGGANVTPVPLSNPLNWGVDKGGGCGSGGDNYQFGSCYQGKRCVQCQHGGQWLSYNCFENDSSCTGDVVYCDQPWSVKTCANGAHKCCDASKGLCIKSGNKPATGTENISVCLGTGADAVCDSPTEYCGGAGGSCNSGDALVSPSKICDSAANKRCCLKKANTCTGTGYGCINTWETGATNNAKCVGKGYKVESAAFSCGDSSKICCYGTTPATSDCDKNYANCGAGNSHYQGDNKFSYYKSKSAECAGTELNKDCYSISDSTNCKQLTWTEVGDNYCSGEAPTTSACTTSDPKSCTGLEGCVGGNSNGYYISGNTTDGTLKYWEKNGSDCNNKTLAELKTDCGCKAGTVSQCTFADGTTLDFGKTLCKNNTTYTCSSSGVKTGPKACDPGLVCETGDNPQKCVDMSNLGANACKDEESGARTECGKYIGDVVKTLSCTDPAGWAGTGKYTIVCGTSSPWLCQYYYTFNAGADMGGVTWDRIHNLTSVSTAKYATVCERTANQSRTFGVSLTVKNLGDFATYGGKLTSGSICVAASADGPNNCHDINVGSLNASSDTASATFTVKPGDSISWIFGYVIDSNGHVYQANLKQQIDEYTPPQAGGYGLIVDIQSPTK